MNAKVRLGFIGAGNMATALCRGVVGAGVFQPAEILASDPDDDRREAFTAATGAPTTPDNRETCRADTVVLAVKPQVMPAVLDEIGPLFSADTLVISIAAGIGTARIEAASKVPLHVVRAMPNTPMLIGEGAAALCKGAHATADDLTAARRLFESCAFVTEVEEGLMHAVTALSGSGPAYLFYLAEQMAHAGSEMGLPAEKATALTRKTLLGAARMLVETGEKPDELRRKVTSPGGTTEAAIASMERDRVAESIVRALCAACERSRELGADPA